MRWWARVVRNLRAVQYFLVRERKKIGKKYSPIDIRKRGPVF